MSSFAKDDPLHCDASTNILSSALVYINVIYSVSPCELIKLRKQVSRSFPRKYSPKINEFAKNV